ncbi:hypothetical protein FA15DRAFT_699664 [Coprinopsis marcescibilis]|uniref:Elongin-A n=1 Tax=Coprinopsis marcescibilis TaxID=230819 RepID=A0A5C3LBD1_COPMA|nr:hypothetical protein FA15DRAFT_699664 [Coprinopsis marcescibilis]
MNSPSRVPSLVSMSQRVAGNNSELITSLGVLSLDYRLVKPILQKCSIEQLLRLEAASPILQRNTPEIWKGLCFQKYRLIAEERYPMDDEPQEPDSWRQRYFVLQEAEARRFEEIGSKIRSQRMEADERKKGKEVKFTDLSIPPPKRPRTGGGWGSSAPKTLFEKTVADAHRIQRAFYGAPLLPPMHTGKTHRVLPKANDCILPPTPKTLPSRVKVTTVSVQRPIRLPFTSSSMTTSSSRRTTPSSSTPTTPASSTSSPPCIPIPRGVKRLSDSEPSRSKIFNYGSQPRDVEMPKVPPNPSAGTSSTPPKTRPVKSPAPIRKDPMSLLFVPKHRAHSQRPVR